MTEEPVCPRCGAKSASAVPQALCPACLLRMGLESQSSGQAASAAPSLAATLDHAPGGASQRGDTESMAELLSPGEQFGDYRIARRLGAGGMGAVYAADQMQTGRHVALKVLKHSLASSEARKRFLREGGWRPRSITPTASTSTAPRRSPARRSSAWSWFPAARCRTA